MLEAVCSCARGPSAVSAQSPEPIEPSDPRDPGDPRDQRELIDDPLAIHRHLTGALTIFKENYSRGNHFSCNGFQRTENREKHKMQNTRVQISKSRESKQLSVERVTGVLSTGCPARSEPLHPLDRPQTVNRLLAAALSTCSAALLLCSPARTFTYTDTQIHMLKGCPES